jgi:hypothetical protein
MGSLTETSFKQQAAGIKDKAAHWRYHIEQWQLSDLTQAVYCQQQELSLAAMGYWRTRLKKLQAIADSPEVPVSFVPVQLTSMNPSLTLRTQQGLSLDLSAGFDPALLKEVLQVLVTVQ